MDDREKRIRSDHGECGAGCAQWHLLSLIDDARLRGDSERIRADAEYILRTKMLDKAAAKRIELELLVDDRDAKMRAFLEAAGYPGIDALVESDATVWGCLGEEVARLRQSHARLVEYMLYLDAAIGDYAGCSGNDEWAALQDARSKVDAAIVAWNDRAPEPPAGPTCEELAEALRRVIAGVDEWNVAVTDIIGKPTRWDGSYPEEHDLIARYDATKGGQG